MIHLRKGNAIQHLLNWIVSSKRIVFLHYKRTRQQSAYNNVKNNLLSGKDQDLRTTACYTVKQLDNSNNYRFTMALGLGEVFTHRKKGCII